MQPLRNASVILLYPNDREHITQNFRNDGLQNHLTPYPAKTRRSSCMGLHYGDTKPLGDFP